jgi:hypothetical protein
MTIAGNLNDLDDQDLMLATVQWPAIKTSHHFFVTSKSKCVGPGF